jgi:hypothetical protein
MLLERIVAYPRDNSGERNAERVAAAMLCGEWRVTSDESPATRCRIPANRSAGVCPEAISGFAYGSQSLGSVIRLFGEPVGREN